VRRWATFGAVIFGLSVICLWGWRAVGGDNSADASFALAVTALVALLIAMVAASLQRTASRQREVEHLAFVEDLARHDDLTGLYNYRYLRENLRAVVGQARTDAEGCALAVFDIDDFKQANERCGHLAGDGMLGAIAAAIRDVVGTRGVVARIGGDEFAAVLPQSTRDEAERICAAVVAAVGDASIGASELNQHLRLGVSCGVACFPEDGEDDDQLIIAADRALHAAQRQAAALREQTAERHAQDVFFSIGQAMGQSLDAQETLNNLVRAVGIALDLDTCSIRLFADSDRALVRSYYLADESQAQIYLPIESEQPLTHDEIYTSGLLSSGVTYLDDMRASERLVERYRAVIDPGIWMVNVPLSGQRDGMLSLTAAHARTVPLPSDLVLAIARLAEAALQNCDVYEGAKRQRDQLSSLAGIGGLLFGPGDFEERLRTVAEAVGLAFEVDALTIDTVDPEGEKPFCRHVYARVPAGVAEEEHERSIAAWRSLRPQLTEPDTARFLADLTGPVVIEDAMNSPLVVDAYRDVVRAHGINTVVLVPINWQRELKGLFYFTSYRLHAFDEQDVAMMRTVAAQIAPSLQIATLHVDLKHSFDELKEAHLEAILRLAYAAEARDPYTGRHLHRIKAFSGALAKEMGLEGEDLEQLGYGAVVHDLGKLRIPDSILIKAGELTDDEWKTMKRHPEYGAEFLGSSSFYDVARQVAMHHHERWDGSGYPRGLAGDNIPLAARIVSVADVYDALTSDRPYKVAWPPERALAELLQMRGKSLCPYSVDAFLRLWNNGTIAEIERESGHASFEFDFRERYAA
jgi:diguanylate cyclase (GGDEF)-like protein